MYKVHKASGNYQLFFLAMADKMDMESCCEDNEW
jgi:hypothetical protein